MSGVNDRREMEASIKKRRINSRKLRQVQVLRACDSSRGCRCATEQVSEDAMVKVEEMMEQLKADHRGEHGEVIAEKTAHRC